MEMSQEPFVVCEPLNQPIAESLRWGGKVWNAWDDWKTYNLDATWRIPQGSHERVRPGNVGYLKTHVERPGEVE